MATNITIFDEIKVGHTNYAPTLYDTTNNVVDNAWWYREGPFMYGEVMIRWTGAGAGGAAFTVSIPSGYTIDTARLIGGSNTSNQLATNIGYSTYWNAGGTWYVTMTKFNTTSDMKFVVGGSTLLGTTFTTNYSLQVFYKVPIVGWY
jgi:hypothetical protein